MPLIFPIDRAKHSLSKYPANVKFNDTHLRFLVDEKKGEGGGGTSLSLLFDEILRGVSRDHDVRAARRMRN